MGAAARPPVRRLRAATLGAASAAQPEPAWKAELAKNLEKGESVIETSKDADGAVESTAKENTIPRRASIVNGH